jgi:Tfp pilus assembly protein PilF
LHSTKTPRKGGYAAHLQIAPFYMHSHNSSYCDINVQKAIKYDLSDMIAQICVMHQKIAKKRHDRANSDIYHANVHLSQLYGVIALTMLFLILQGVQVVASGKRRQVDTHWKRGMSYL